MPDVNYYFRPQPANNSTPFTDALIAAGAGAADVLLEDIRTGTVKLNTSTQSLHTDPLFRRL